MRFDAAEGSGVYVEIEIKEMPDGSRRARLHFTTGGVKSHAEVAVLEDGTVAPIGEGRTRNPLEVLASHHPEYTSAQLAEAVREAMEGQS